MLLSLYMLSINHKMYFLQVQHRFASMGERSGHRSYNESESCEPFSHFVLYDRVVHLKKYSIRWEDASRSSCWYNR